ncbi:siderophore-iron reductase FhuF [Rhizobiales bacterium RZME27]|jgi:ferric iron reductase protein FhuF|uniref:Siderophore-iron reductase FhuF n=1 Tax=Endobacterium cereale TaxID=2663029 RepID=A0A6A8AI97_9HYPH|nr:siderophore-iron reductase FhuF [Endobacterium cereale]MQY49547.1 siderophore-iron reductase FhuF [Endobacterium cereale]
MIPELSHIFQGPFGALGETLSIDIAPTMPLGNFCSSPQLHNTLDIFARRWPERDPRVVATQWSKTYFSTLLPAVLLPCLLHDWHLPLSPQKMGIRISAAGAVSGFELPSSGGHRNAQEKASGRFDFLVADHLRPIIEMLAAATPLPAKVLWSNAGNVFENVVGRASSLLGHDHPAVREAMAIMADRRNATGRANPLFEPIRYINEGGKNMRQRRICCLRYFTPELGYCKSCPKPGPEPDGGS